MSHVRKRPAWAALRCVQEPPKVPLRTRRRGATAVEHGHPQAVPHITDGLIDDAKTLGDDQAITQGMPNVAVNGSRVDVNEAPDGHLRMQMVDGDMTRNEAQTMGPRLDQRQQQIEIQFQRQAEGQKTN